MTRNKLLSLLLAVTIAFVLWVYVITVVSPNSEATFYNIPVVLQGEPMLESYGLMNVTEHIPTVTLKLSGNRSDLNKVNSSNITVVADLSKVYEAGTTNLRYSISYPGDIPTGAFKEESRYPGTITIEVERKIKKDVPVNIRYVGELSEDFIVDKENKILDYNTVTVAGPESVIDQITQAIIDVDLTGKTVSFSNNYRYSLCNAQDEPVDAQKVDTNVAQVNLTLYIERVKELPLVLTVVSGGGATEETSNIKIDPATVKVSGSDLVMEKLTELNLGTINLGEVLEDTEMEFAIVLPEGVKFMDPDVETAKVTLKFPNLATRTLTVSDIQAKNVPAGMDVEFLTKSLNVTIRGDKNLIKNIVPPDVSVIVDFADAQLGSYTVKPIIRLANIYSSVGAIGNYSVSVTVRSTTENG
jgi:YbbR domain-containing protein